MAVAGASGPWAAIVVELARQMLSAMVQLVPELKLCVGVHSGPVVAGVIGKGER